MADIYGTGNSDYLPGSPYNDQIYGNAGNDWLYGNGGNDQLHGQNGHDYLSGGDGNDSAYGGDDSGWDTLIGGNGFDNLHGGYGNDSLSGDSGNDILYGDYNDDQLLGGSGDDYLNGGSGNDVLDGYNVGSVERDRLRGDLGADTFVLGHIYNGQRYYGYAGSSSWSYIEDFNRNQGDKIQVTGNIGEYTLTTRYEKDAGSPGVIDTLIWKGNDVLAVVVDTNLTQISKYQDFKFI
ncbi:calcium-binding protein [Planktothrix sp. FACHB-1365]|uniref:calcium-binding protein n=1 Tax=Planktothrix sp. FACHB-1365 TaxID=2692855 RepID=UPI001687F3DA|nr:calcium-binding protein [Planktothrix sp. FACHB-1365]MBD2483063.1 hemolysin-type calcium-binding protein [Planktothrix sp. FACHB-1365]